MFRMLFVRARFIHRALFVLFALYASLAFAGKPVANPPPTVSITSPASGATFTAPANIALTAVAADANGTVTQVAYYRGTTLIGTATSAPYSVTWSNVAAGSYSLTAKATDNGGAVTTSAAVAITVSAGGGGGGGGNITIASPANGATVYSASVTVTGTFVGSSTSSYVLADNGASSRFATLTGNSYSATLPVNLGSNTLTVSVARADKTSDKASITVNGSAPPLVVFTSPTSTTNSAPANITLGVDAVSPGGSIASVSFARNGTLLGTVNSPPYSYNWQNVGAGTYAVTATAVDNNGQTGNAALSLQVGPPNLLPSVSITKPTGGQQFTAPGSIEIEVGANDPDGSVSQVEFLQNGVSLGASNVAPYKLTWPNVPQGSYALTARATDNSGGVATSPAVNINVNPQPPIAMGAGIDGATFQAPASVALSASTGGPALGVSFYQVVNSTNTLIGDSPSTGSPYTYSWNVRSAGTYTVVARTLMMVSGFPTPFEFWSSPATFTVAANPAGEITYLHHDFAGSVIAATDVNGAVIWKEDYKPYGERVMNAPAAVGNRQFFTGKPLDLDTGLSYMGARYYDPAVGRFMGVDPAGFTEGKVQSFNRFAYANNNPYRFVDPDGRSPLTIFAIEVAKQTGAGYLLGVGADAVSQYAAFGSVDWGLAATSDAAVAGGMSGLLSGAVSGAVKGYAAASAASSATKEASAISKAAKERVAPGGDGAKSVQIIERESGTAISRTHEVTKDGKVLHQHQNHTGKHGGNRQFPDEWTGTKTINAPYENVPPSFPADRVPGGRAF
ncbi:MAG: Ig-like domain-containing protein [Pseudomonadota bacterium]